MNKPLFPVIALFFSPQYINLNASLCFHEDLILRSCHCIFHPVYRVHRRATQRNLLSASKRLRAISFPLFSRTLHIALVSKHSPWSFSKHLLSNWFRMFFSAFYWNTFAYINTDTLLSGSRIEGEKWEYSRRKEGVKKWATSSCCSSTQQCNKGGVF